MIIGLTGLAGSGKSEAANYLQKEHGFYRVNMKDALVAEMRENFKDVFEKMIYKLDYDECEEPWTVDRLFTEKPPIMRALMQNYGTDVRRKDNDRYWIRQWGKTVDTLVSAGKNVVVDDVRFLNEGDAVKLRGGSVIRIERSDLTQPMGHISETEMAGIDADLEISADKGDLNELYGYIDKFITDET